MTSTPEPISVLFVCLGNICRSTMAEGVLKSMVSKPPYKSLFKAVDSAGTASYHIGTGPDERTMSTLKGHGITDYVHAGRQIHSSDFEKFDYILCMDQNNMRNVERVNTGTGKAKVMLLGEFAGKKRPEIVDDPWAGDLEDFEVTYEQCTRLAKNFLKQTFPDVKA